MPTLPIVCAALAILVAQPSSASESSIRQIEIHSRWGGLGEPSSTTIVIRNENGVYRTDGKEIDPAKVQALVAVVRDQAIPEPSPANLGLTRERLEAQANEILQTALAGKEEDSTYWAIRSATPEQRDLFRASYTNPKFIAKVLPDLFRCCHTDDYPGVKITITDVDGSSIGVSSSSQSEYMLPWEVTGKSNDFKTFNRSISVALAALMPNDATNLERIRGDHLPVALAEAVLSRIEDEWKLIRAEGMCKATLAQIRDQYELIRADVNPYHDVAFGVYSTRKQNGVEQNLHADVRKPDFPTGLSETAILKYRNGNVLGVDDFLKGASRYEKLVLSVPWLVRLWKNHPDRPITLLWVHDASFSDKAMLQFANDMHRLHKDALAEDVRKVKRDVAVLNVSYGDWWLVLPDKRMILWRYESISGLLGFKVSSFTSRECTDYQGVTGGCVGAIVSPDGNLVR